MPEFDETPVAERGTGAAAEAGASLFDTEPSSASQQPTPGHMSHRTKKMVQVLESKFQEEGPKIDFSKLSMCIDPLQMTSVGVSLSYL